MAKLGESIQLECPACAAPLVLPVAQTGADLRSITLVIDLGAMRHHIATTHPQENTMSAFTDRLHALIARFTSIGKADVEEIVTAAEEHLVPLLDNARAGLLGDVKSLVSEAVAEAKHLESEALADIKAELVAIQALLTQQPAPAAAPAEPPAAS